MLMLRSVLPCAMARMFTSASASALNARPLTPIARSIPLPTNATMLNASSTRIGAIRLRVMSEAKSCCSAATPASRSLAAMPTVKLFSDELWVISVTLTPA